MEQRRIAVRPLDQISRRDVLRRGALGVVSLGLAGCAGAPAPPTIAPVPTPIGGSTPLAVATVAPATAVSQPKYGGALKTIATSGERTLDPHMAGGAVGGVGNYVFYSQLLTYKRGPDVKPPSYTPTGDLAESLTQPDDLTYTFKLRQGVKFHNIAPVNGRELVADDVVFSYNHIRDLKAYASLLQGVLKIEAPDKYTVKLTLDKPNADLLRNLSEVQMAVVAREQVDQQRDLTQPPVIGTRNPDYFQKGLPYADRSFIGCALEGVAVSKMPPFAGKEVGLESYCPCCMTPIHLTGKDGAIMSSTPSPLLVHVSMTPREWNSENNIAMCDSMNFVLDADHAARYERLISRRGVLMDLDQARRMVATVADTRMWDFNRQPHGGTTPEGSIASLRRLGVDTSNWEA
jgi:hypothetical protein